MSCGCNSVPVASRDLQRSRAAMCYTCPDVRGFNRDECGLSGQPIAEHITPLTVTCRNGRLPDAQGIVNWLWLDWFGVPAPIRWKLKGKLSGPLPGCGCTVIGKAAWLRFKAWWSFNSQAGVKGILFAPLNGLVPWSIRMEWKELRERVG